MATHSGHFSSGGPPLKRPRPSYEGHQRGSLISYDKTQNPPLSASRADKSATVVEKPKWLWTFSQNILEGLMEGSKMAVDSLKSMGSFLMGNRGPWLTEEQNGSFGEHEYSEDSRPGEKRKRGEATAQAALSSQPRLSFTDYSPSSPTAIRNSEVKAPSPVAHNMFQTPWTTATQKEALLRSANSASKRRVTLRRPSSGPSDRSISLRTVLSPMEAMDVDQSKDILEKSFDEELEANGDAVTSALEAGPNEESKGILEASFDEELDPVGIAVLCASPERIAAAEELHPPHPHSPLPVVHQKNLTFSARSAAHPHHLAADFVTSEEEAQPKPVESRLEERDTSANVTNAGNVTGDSNVTQDTFNKGFAHTASIDEEDLDDAEEDEDSENASYDEEDEEDDTQMEDEDVVVLSSSEDEEEKDDSERPYGLVAELSEAPPVPLHVKTPPPVKLQFGDQGAGFAEFISQMESVDHISALPPMEQHQAPISIDFFHVAGGSEDGEPATFAELVVATTLNGNAVGDQKNDHFEDGPAVLLAEEQTKWRANEGKENEVEDGNEEVESGDEEDEAEEEEEGETDEEDVDEEEEEAVEDDSDIICDGMFVQVGEETFEDGEGSNEMEGSGSEEEAGSEEEEDVDKGEGGH